MTDNASPSNTWVSGATYHPAGPMTQWTSPVDNFTETRQYNALAQLTRITYSNGGGDTEYVFSGTQNNGRILQRINHTSGETVGYSYDSLNRLLTAGSTSGSWGESFTYDGFGNLTDKTVTAGSAPALHITVNPATNRADTNYTYDANGNVLTSRMDNSISAGYDALNRITSVTSFYNTDYYGYTPDNNRVWKQEPTTANYGEIHFFGAFGEELGTYQILQYNPSGQTYYYYLYGSTTNLYFAGRLVYGKNFGAATQDRLGSLGSYYPYGEEYSTTQQDTFKFATYYRDQTTVLDYARNRYYSSTLGRFMTADPYRASGGPADPGSWNRYAYTKGDPVNKNDSGGLDDCLDCVLDGGGGSSCFFGDPSCSCGDPTGLPFGPGGDGLGLPCPPKLQEPPSDPSPPPASCSITLYSRGTPNQLGGPGNHTYILIDDPNQGIFDVLEGAPTHQAKFKNPWGGNWGNLFGDIFGTDGNVTKLLGGTNPDTNIVASITGGPAICKKVDAILGDVKNYDEPGGPFTHVPYRPVPKKGLGYYNSNSFTFTLLSQAGLVGLFPWPPPGWTPGWNLMVPGL